MRLLLAALAVLTAGFPQTASAASRIIFYSHGWDTGPKGKTVYPHAFVRIQHEAADGTAVDRSYGFYTRTFTSSLVGSQGFIRTTANHNYLYSKPDFWLEISEEQYQAVMARIAWWNSPEGSAYNVWSRNCFDFVADIAVTVGLKPGNTRTFKPRVFISETYQLNPGRLRSPDELDLKPAEPSLPPSDVTPDGTDAPDS